MPCPRCELYHMGEFHAVDDVVLLGAPVTTEARKWQKVQHRGRRDRSVHMSCF